MPVLDTLSQAASPNWVGKVRQVSSLRGELMKKNNLVVDVAVQMMANALMGADQIDAVIFGLTGGVVVTPGLRSIFNPIHRSPAGSNSSLAPFITRDANNLSSICNWTATYTNSGVTPLSYDMLGLVSQNDRLFAALSFPAVTLSPSETIAVEWSILLRG
jgi:hypothetical protein